MRVDTKLLRLPRPFLNEVTPLKSIHSVSRRIWSSSSGVKSFWMLNVLRISSGGLPSIMFAAVLQPASRSGF
jgi:hypothetical protein